MHCSVRIACNLALPTGGDYILDILEDDTIYYLDISNLTKLY